MGGSFTPAQTFTINPFNMGWDSASNITYNGSLAALTFKVGDDVADGIYPITLDYYKGVNGNYTDGDDVNYTENLEPIILLYSSGSVTVNANSESSGNSVAVSGISFTVTLSGNTNIGTVYAAMYNSDGQLKSVKQYPAADTVNVAFDKGITGAYIKIMWWNDNMTPMCNVQTIPLQ